MVRRAMPAQRLSHNVVDAAGPAWRAAGGGALSIDSCYRNRRRRRVGKGARRIREGLNRKLGRVRRAHAEMAVGKRGRVGTALYRLLGESANIARAFAHPTARSRSIVGAEPSVPRVRHQPAELDPVEVDERRVIAAFEIDVGLFPDAVVDDDVEVVALADRRHCAERAVRKQRLDLPFGGHLDVVADLPPQLEEPDVVRGRQHRQHVAAVAAQHDGLGEAIAGDVAGLRGAGRRHRGVVGHHLVGDVAVEMLLERRGDGHGGPPCDAVARTREGPAAGRRLASAAAGCETRLGLIPADLNHPNRPRKGARPAALRALGVTATVRLRVLPDIPPLGDVVPGYAVTGWLGVGVPKGTPGEIVERLNREVNAALADPAVKARMADLGSDPLPGSVADFTKLIAEETEKWAKVVKFAGLKAEQADPSIEPVCQPERLMN